MAVFRLPALGVKVKLLAPEMVAAAPPLNFNWLLITSGPAVITAVAGWLKSTVPTVPPLGKLTVPPVTARLDTMLEVLRVTWPPLTVTLLTVAAVPTVVFPPPVLNAETLPALMCTTAAEDRSRSNRRGTADGGRAAGERGRRKGIGVGIAQQHRSAADAQRRGQKKAAAVDRQRRDC